MQVGKVSNSSINYNKINTLKNKNINEMTFGHKALKPENKSTYFNNKNVGRGLLLGSLVLLSGATIAATTYVYDETKDFLTSTGAGLVSLVTGLYGLINLEEWISSDKD